MHANVAAAITDETEDPILPLDVIERAHISRALVRAGGRQSVAADLLRIERRRLYRKVKAYGLEDLTLSGAA
jgi:DNA-binding NtrC family response regulator